MIFIVSRIKQKLAKFAGIAWTKHQSGDFGAAHTRLINSGNWYLRYYTMEVMNFEQIAADPLLCGHFCFLGLNPPFP